MFKYILSPSMSDNKPEFFLGVNSCVIFLDVTAAVFNLPYIKGIVRLIRSPCCLSLCPPLITFEPSRIFS